MKSIADYGPRHDPTPDRLNTPCARCGHGHAQRNRHDECGEMLSFWSWQRVEFTFCCCPEWVVPPYRCVCGKPSLRPFPAWLGDIRACSKQCAAQRLEAAAA